MTRVPLVLYGKAVPIEAWLASAMDLDQVFQKQKLYHLSVASYGVFQCHMKCHVSYLCPLPSSVHSVTRHTAKPFSIKQPGKLQTVLESVYQINSLFPQKENIAT